MIQKGNLANKSLEYFRCRVHGSLPGSVVGIVSGGCGVWGIEQMMMMTHFDKEPQKLAGIVWIKSKLSFQDAG